MNPQGNTESGPAVPAPAPAASRHIEAHGLALHYLDYGTEGLPPMLCVHGGAAHAHWYDFVASAFTPAFHVRALDLRGHGDSAWTDPPAYGYRAYADDVHALAEQLDLREFVLIGHSMGGMVALMYASLYPGRMAKLVVVDTSTLLPASRIEKMREFGSRPASSYATREELVARYRLEPPGTHMTAPEILRHVAQWSGREDADGRWRHKFDRSVYATFERVDGLPFWADVKVPALVVRGSLSDRIDAKTLAAIRARAPHVELATVAHADHHVMLDNPQGFIDAVRPFLLRS